MLLHQKVDFVPQYYSTIILGGTFSAAFFLTFLKENDPEKEIYLLAGKKLEELPLVLRSFSMDKNEELSEEFQNFFEAEDAECEPVFFKDGQSFSFERKKKLPAPLKKSELIFTKREVVLETEKLNEIFQQYTHCISSLIPEKIEKLNEGKKQWRITTTNGATFECGHLIFCANPSDFIKLFKNSSKSDLEFLKPLRDLKNERGLMLSWKLNQPVFSETGRVFVPQSLTHEWGYFILDVQTFKEGLQSCVVRIFLEKEASTEEISRKIKLLKTVVTRNFPLFKKAKVKEKITLIEECFNTDQRIYSQLEKHFSDLTFSGPWLSSSLLTSKVTNYLQEGSQSLVTDSCNTIS